MVDFSLEPEREAESISTACAPEEMQGTRTRRSLAKRESRDVEIFPGGWSSSGFDSVDFEFDIPLRGDMEKESKVVEKSRRRRCGRRPRKTANLLQFFASKAVHVFILTLISRPRDTPVGSPHVPKRPTISS